MLQEYSRDSLSPQVSAAIASNGSKGYRVLAATDDECNVADQEEPVMGMTKPSRVISATRGLSSSSFKRIFFQFLLLLFRVLVNAKKYVKK